MESIYMLSVADNLYKIGDAQAARAMLSEAFASRRKFTELDKNSLESLGYHVGVFYEGGKLLALDGKFNDALAAYNEADRAGREILDKTPENKLIRSLLGKLYMSVGDLYSDSTKSSTSAKNNVRLKQARQWYQKAFDLLTKLQANNLATQEDKENLRLSEEKLARLKN